MPVRIFCGVPTTGSHGIDIALSARQWHAAGRRLLVVTASPDAVLKTAPGSAVVGHFLVSDDADPERVFERAPRRFAPVPVEIWLVEVSPNPR